MLIAIAHTLTLKAAPPKAGETHLACTQWEEKGHVEYCAVYERRDGPREIEPLRVLTEPSMPERWW